MSKSAGQIAAAESAASGPQPPISSSASSNNLAGVVPQSSSKWNPRTLWRASSRQLPRSASNSVAPSPPATPGLAEMTHRMPYVLRQVQHHAHLMNVFPFALTFRHLPWPTFHTIPQVYIWAVPLQHSDQQLASQFPSVSPKSYPQLENLASAMNIVGAGLILALMKSSELQS